MCYQLVERYNACRCIYYQHSIDRCPRYGTRGHNVTKRDILVGYACMDHTQPAKPDSYDPEMSHPISTYSNKGYRKHMDAKKNNKQSLAGKRIRNRDTRGVDENDLTQGKAAEQEVLPNHVDNIALGPDSDSEEADISDTESVISVASSTTTIDEDALEAIFRRLLLFRSLRYLWPQLVARCGSRNRSLRTIERLLRRWSDDLSILAASSELTNSDSKICLSACRFLRRSRLSLAQRICEAHLSQVERCEVGAGIPTKYGTEPSMEEMYDPEDFVYAVSERLLFDTAPILSLQASVRALVNPKSHETDNIVKSLYRSVEVWLTNFMTMTCEQTVPPGKKRLWWECGRCGHKMYDDYTELKPGAVERLGKVLQDYLYQDPNFADLVDADSHPSSTTTGHKDNLAGIINRFRGIFTSSKSWTLPSRQPSRQSVDSLGVCPVIPQTPQTNHNFVLLCVPFMQRAVKLHQAEVCRINSDQEFFRVLRYYYASQRGFRSWARLRKVRSIDFVKFEMYKSQLVDIQTRPSIPPETHTQDYTYDPLPAETTPPIGTNLLMHLFEYPDHAECEPVLYKKVPKKLDYKLEACPVKKSAIGWGVSFVEGLNWFTAFIYGCAGFASALVLAVAWSMIRGDIQGGFAIAGFMLAFIGFCMGIARIEIEMA